MFQVSFLEYALYDVHMCSHVYSCAQMCACEGLRLTSSISSDCSPPYLLRHDLLLDMVLTVWVSLTSQLASEIPPPPRSPSFPLGSGIGTVVLRLVQQALHLWSHLPSLLCHWLLFDYSCFISWFLQTSKIKLVWMKASIVRCVLIIFLFLSWKIITFFVYRSSNLSFSLCVCMGGVFLCKVLALWWKEKN